MLNKVDMITQSVTPSLVGKTVTIKDGLIVSIA